MFITIGLLLSYVSNYAFAGLPVHLGWRIMYAVGVAPPVLLAMGVLLRTSDTPAEADLRLDEIKHAVNESDSNGGNVWKELLIRACGGSIDFHFAKSTCMSSRLRPLVSGIRAYTNAHAAAPTPA